MYARLHVTTEGEFSGSKEGGERVEDLLNQLDLHEYDADDFVWESKWLIKACKQSGLP